jgi:hypothetical protein
MLRNYGGNGMCNIAQFGFQVRSKHGLRSWCHGSLSGM